MNWFLFSPRFLLIVVIVFGFVLRFYNLGENPPSLTWDEAAWGYNAYALSLYGEDEFGKSFPFDYFESFGDFKPPVYAYLTVIPVMLFGLNEFATRFPSAFFGSLTVLVTYFLVLQIFYRSEKKHLYALFSALFLAVSPWHINLSRAAFEANVATFFIVTGVWLFLKSVHQNKWLLVFSGVSFVLSMYTFNTARIVAPLLVILLGVSSFTFIKTHLKVVCISALIGMLTLLPTLPFFLSPQASLRFNEVNIFSDIGIVEKANKNIERDNSLFSRIVNNRRVFYVREYLKHYFDNLSPSFLFVNGDGNPKFSTRTVGQLYLWDAPFLIFGLLYLFRKREGKWYLIPLWILIGIAPAATARETPHALRIETVLPTFQILVAYGLVQVLALLKHVISKTYIYRSIIAVLFLALIINVLYYIHGYYVHYPRVFSGEWQYGYKDSIIYVSENSDTYDTVYITDTLGRPYIYYLYYLGIDPKKFQQTAQVKREVLGFVTVEGFDNLRFVNQLPHDEEHGNVLFIATPGDVPGNANVLRRFTLLNGVDSLVAYTL